MIVSKIEHMLLLKKIKTEKIRCRMKYIKHLAVLILLSHMGITSYAQVSGDEKKVFINNETTINTDKLDYSPAFHEDGIVFISSKISNKRYKVKDKRIGKNVMSIFSSTREESGLLQAPVPFAKELLSTVHEGPVTFDRTGEHIYFTRNNIKNGKRKKAKDGIVKLKIYTAETAGDRWMNIEELPFNDDQSNTAHPAISVEGDIIYFSSDREGSLGKMDIWMSKRAGDSWGPPVNLGPEVNSEGDDIFPFIHADGSLFFASNGHAGFGGLDMFFVNPNGERWTKPTNMGAPFNSENDDFGYIIDRDKKNGYFSSDRPGGVGQDDIYSFYVSGGLDDLYSEVKPKVVKNYTIIVSDQVSGEMIEGSTITFTNLDNLSFAQALSGGVDLQQQLSEKDKELLVRVPLDADSKTGMTDNWGKFPVDLATGNYVFIVEQEGYKPRQVVIDTEQEASEIFVSLEKPSAADLAGANGNNATGSGVPAPMYDVSGNPLKFDSNGNPILPSGSTVYDADGNPVGNVGPDNQIYDNDGNLVNTSAFVDNTSVVTNVTSGPSSTSFPSTIKEGTVFQLPNIYYNFNDASIRPDAKIDLDALADFLVQYPDIEIELSSHTDSRGGTRYNKKLSQKRAESSVDYLINRGLSASRMTAVGYGESQLRNHCSDGKDCSEDEHQYNRRTEVKITRMSQEINIQFVNSASAPSYSDAGSSYSEGSASYVDIQVIAGVFSKYENAQKRIGQLLDAGYPNAEILNVDGSSNYTILVKRCDSIDEAKEIKRILKDYKIRAFVKS